MLEKHLPLHEGMIRKEFFCCFSGIFFAEESSFSKLSSGFLRFRKSFFKAFCEGFFLFCCHLFGAEENPALGNIPVGRFFFQIAVTRIFRRDEGALRFKKLRRFSDGGGNPADPSPLKAPYVLFGVKGRIRYGEKRRFSEYFQCFRGCFKPSDNALFVRFVSRKEFQKEGNPLPAGDHADNKTFEIRSAILGMPKGYLPGKAFIRKIFSMNADVGGIPMKNQRFRKEGGQTFHHETLIEERYVRITQVIQKTPYHVIVQMLRTYPRADEAFCGKVFEKLMEEVEPAFHKAKTVQNHCFCSLSRGDVV